MVDKHLQRVFLLVSSRDIGNCTAEFCCRVHPTKPAAFTSAAAAFASQPAAQSAASEPATSATAALSAATKPAAS